MYLRDPDQERKDRVEFTTLSPAAIREDNIRQRVDAVMRDRSGMFGLAVRKMLEMHLQRGGEVIYDLLCNASVSHVLNADAEIRKAAECLIDERMQEEELARRIISARIAS